MAVSLLYCEVSDLCIGKPPVRSLHLSATVGEALLALKACGETYLSVWSCERSPEKKTCLGKVCLVDVICYLCAEENLYSPSSALKSPVSVLLPKDSGLVRRVEWHASVTEALDQILDGAQNLVVPITGGTARKKLHASALNFCWLTQEDFVRFFLNSIGHFSSIAALSVESLGIIQSDALAVFFHDPALSTVPLIKQAVTLETAVAVITDDGKLIGEISPPALASCDETVAAAIATLSAGALMAYIDCGGQREDIECAVKACLMEKKMEGMLEMLEEDFWSSSLFSSSSSSSSDEESSEETSPPSGRRAVGYRRTGSYSARMSRRSEEAIVCHPKNSLLAAMIQALAHRVSYVWVVEEDYKLIGIVTFSDVLNVFRKHLRAIEE